ncbi:MAG: hypothetical protein QOJ81_636 [Chloroflexota bacterium]|jgi:hypothetical protein|nr:hypothetical protein [Chloroflexota bacterium]
MGAAGILRRSLLIWGWGHISLGDRRGWLLVLLQPLAITGLLFVASQLIEGTRWLAVFLPLVALLVFWIGQAVNAHRRALAKGAAPGGELQLALFLPVVLAAISAFWLVGGRHSSPASAVEGYMAAWQAGRPDIAVGLFGASGPPQADVAAFWEDERAFLVTTIDHGRATYGPSSGLDPARPFSSLRVTQTGPTTFTVELVRSESYQTTLLGFIPTAGQRTVVIAPLMTLAVVEQASAGAWLKSSTWRIAFVVPQGAV